MVIDLNLGLNLDLGLDLRANNEESSETTEIDEAGARTTPGFDDPLPAIGGRRTVTAVVAGDIVPIAGLR